MNKIPTIDDLMLAESCDIYAEGPVFSESGYSHDQVRKLAISFAKLHVKAALEAAADKADMEGDEGSVFDGIYIDKNSILNSYPENLIQ